MAEKRDFYDVLGVAKSSTDKEIKKAFKLLAKKYHPDISKEDDAENKFKEIQEAYAILSDQNKRAQYDQYGHAAFDQMGGGAGYEGFDFSDIFGDIFGGGFGGGFGGRQSANQNGPRRGRDMEINVRLTFKEAVFGTKKDIAVKREVDCTGCNGTGAKDPSSVVTCNTCGGQGRVQRQQRTILGMAMTESICPSCQGQGKTIKDKCHKCHGSAREQISSSIAVNIPAGVDNGAYMRVPQKGEGGYKGATAGDLFLNIYVEEDKFFKRSGQDIHVEIPIGYTQAVLGATVEVPTIHGHVDFKIPAGTQTDSALRLKHKGINKTGDQYVKVKIKTAKKVSGEEKKLLEQLAKFESSHTDQEGFFANIKKLFF